MLKRLNITVTCCVTHMYPYFCTLSCNLVSCVKIVLCNHQRATDCYCKSVDPVTTNKSTTSIKYYYMASSASGQDEPNRALLLATWAGKMEPSCPLGTTRCILHEKFPRKPDNKSFIDQVCSVKMVGYWPYSFFASLWTSTSSRSINTQKKNLANIQPSWPHTWSMTHTYYISDSLLKIWLVESIQSIHNSLWTRHDKCNICYRYCIYHVKFNVCLVTKPLGVYFSEIKWLNASLLFLRMNYVKNV